MKPHWFVIALLAAFPPIAQAQADPYEAVLTVGLDQFSFEGRLAISGTDAANMRRNIDRAVGDGDGTLTRAEVDQWTRNSSGTFSDEEPNCFETFELLRLGGQPPSRVSEVSVNAVGLAGATTSEAPFDYSFVVAFHYRAAAADQATATMNLRDGAFNESVECYLNFNLAGEEALARSDRVLVRPLEPAKIPKQTVQPAQTQQSWHDGGIRFDSADDIPGVLTFTVERSAPSGGLGTVDDVVALVGYGAAGTAGLLGVAYFFTEVGRYKLLRLLFVIPGFTRVEKDEVLEHARRDELYNFIRSNPGPSFSDLRRSLELSNGTLVHHLRILEMQEYVKGERDGFRTRFYVRGPKIVPTTYLTRTQQQLLDAIRAQPGLTQADLSKITGLPRQSLFYQTKQLAAQGKLEIKQDRNRRRYWPRPAAAPPTMGRPLRPT